MKWLSIIALLVGGTVLAQGFEDPNEAQSAKAFSIPTDNAPQAEAKMRDVNGQPVGTVRFYTHDGKTVVTAKVHDLAPGYHGFHVHELAECDPDADNGPFTSAGGHYNGHDDGHAGHKGDMPPLHVNQDGTAWMVVLLDRFTPQNLLEDETAVIIHADPDNFGNIPDRYQSNLQDQTGPDAETLATGDAGARQACGVIKTIPTET